MTAGPCSKERGDDEMPSNWLYIDTMFPSFTGEEDLEEKVTTIQDYIFVLVEQLRYTLHNLDLSNMNAAAVDQWEETITEPLYVRIEGAEGQITQLAITQDGMAGQISDAEGNITALQATAQGLNTRITSAEGNITSLQATASGLSATVANQAGQISSLTQTVSSISLSVSNGTSSSTISLTANGIVLDSARVTFTGAVMFADLSTSGATIINGDNITTGTIYANRIHLGGAMAIYQTATGFDLGGFIGFGNGLTSWGEETNGIILTDSTQTSQMMCTTAGIQIGYKDDAGGGDVGKNYRSHVTCTYTQVSIASKQSIFLNADQTLFLNGDTVLINGEAAATSDARLKKEKQYDVDKYLGVFDKLRPCTFVYEGHKRRHMGLIAQEVQKVLAEEGIPERDFAAVCTYPPSEKMPEGLYVLRYGEIQIMAIAKIQQMAAQIQELKAEIAGMKSGGST